MLPLKKLRGENMRKIDEAYEYIKSYISEKDYPPTIREIGDAINIRSTSTVSYYLRKLEENNKIVKGSYKNRSIQLMENLGSNLEGVDAVSIPYIKNLTMGLPLMSEHNISDKFIFSGSLFKGLNMMLMAVKDNNMKKSGIFKGDMVVVSRQNAGRNGETVVAMLNNDYVVARLYREFNIYKLETDEAEAVYAEKVTLLGKVVGVIRNEIN